MVTRWTGHIVWEGRLTLVGSNCHFRFVICHESHDAIAGQMPTVANPRASSERPLAEQALDLDRGVLRLGLGR